MITAGQAEEGEEEVREIGSGLVLKLDHYREIVDGDDVRFRGRLLRELEREQLLDVLEESLQRVRALETPPLGWGEAEPPAWGNHCLKTVVSKPGTVRASKSWRGDYCATNGTVDRVPFLARWRGDVLEHFEISSPAFNQELIATLGPKSR